LKVHRCQRNDLDPLAGFDPPFLRLDVTGFEPQPEILFSQFLAANNLLDVQERGGKWHPIIRCRLERL
jgi:hypothetical protein